MVTVADPAFWVGVVKVTVFLHVATGTSAAQTEMLVGFQAQRPVTVTVAACASVGTPVSANTVEVFHFTATSPVDGVAADAGSDGGMRTAATAMAANMAHRVVRLAVPVSCRPGMNFSSKSARYG